MKIHKFEEDLIMHFGLGLIGSSLDNILVRNEKLYTIHESVSNWNNLNDLFEDILSGLKGFIHSENHKNLNNFHLVWTAGKSGFLCDEEAADSELFVFNEVIKYIHDLLQNTSFKEKHFYFVSSAGGLYEGLRCIEDTTKINPKRPYGILKKKQEENAISILNDFSSINIYRVSTVFSLDPKHNRKGLINTLIKNTKCQKSTQIIGLSSTLRDYVIDKDVARIINTDIFSRSRKGVNIDIVASGNPVSIEEILNIISHFMGDRPRVNYSFSIPNSENITFRTSNIRRTSHCLELKYLIRRALINCN